jgi:hypothetical protein
MKYRDESDMKQEKRVKDDLRDANWTIRKGVQISKHS